MAPGRACMRIVSLNLDVTDAEVLRTLVNERLAACGCGGGLGDAPCSSCAALAATANELERLLRRPRLRPAAPTRPTLWPVRAPATGSDPSRSRAELRLVEGAAKA